MVKITAAIISVLVVFNFVCSALAFNLPGLRIGYIRKKQSIPKSVSNQRITLRGIVDIAELDFLLSEQIKQVIELSGADEAKNFVDFNGVKLLTVLKYIKDVYGYNYEYSPGVLKLSDIETAVFHLPITPLSNTVTASLGSSGGVTGITGAAAGYGSVSSSAPPTGAMNGAASLNSGSSGSIGGTATENISNISTPFYRNMLKTVKNAMTKHGQIMYSPRYGLLVLKDKVRNVELIKKYINFIKKKIGRVIFVKLKVINVELSSGYDYGINWDNLYSDMGRYLGAGSSLSINFSNTPASSLSGSDGITFNSGTGTQAVINALNNFGTVGIVNQAKLELLSGQTRSLNNITTVPYLEGNQITSIGALGSSAQSTPQLGEATSGINVVYTPTIYRGKIYVSVQLILNTINGYTEYVSGGSSFSLPDVSTQSVSFTIKVPDGKSALVGALQYKSTVKNKEGLPFLDKIPVLGYLFSGGSKSIENNELFLLITPVIIKE